MLYVVLGFLSRKLADVDKIVGVVGGRVLGTRRQDVLMFRSDLGKG